MFVVCVVTRLRRRLTDSHFSRHQLRRDFASNIWQFEVKYQRDRHATIDVNIVIAVHLGHCKVYFKI
jgi:NADH:ubiquinone oxidoreductase subunit C